MAFNFPEGAKFQFSTTFASAKTISALTNADPAVASSTAHGYVDLDEILLTSGWEDATNSIYQVDQIDANSFEIEGLDSSNTAYFAVGTGIGSAQKVSGWTDIPQVMTISNSGGDAKFTDVQLLAARTAIKIPTGFNAVTTTLTLAHDPTNATYKDMLGISRTNTKCAFRILAGGGTSYGYGYMSVAEVPQMQAGQVNQVQCAITMLGRLISY